MLHPQSYLCCVHFVSITDFDTVVRIMRLIIANSQNVIASKTYYDELNLKYFHPPSCVYM